MKERTLRQILPFLRPYRGQLAVGSVLAVGYVAATLIGPVLVGLAIDCIVGPGQVDYGAILRYLLLLAAAMACSAACQWGMNMAVRRVSGYAARDMRLAAYARINRAPLSYIDSQSHGDLISRMVNDADLVSEGILQALTQLLPGAATILGTLGVMAYLNPGIALAVMLITPLSILFAGFVGRRTASMFRRQSAAQGKLGGHINEMVAGREVVQAFGYEERCFEDFDQISEELYQYGFRSIFYSAMVFPGTRFVNAVVYAVVAMVGAVTAISGGLTVGQLSSFLTYANQYTKPFNEITAVLTQIQTALASAARLIQVMNQPAETPDPVPGERPQRSDGQVSLEKVSFRYRREVPLIEDFSLEVEPGSHVAIVGPTGCGKTTLINLLMRFYEVDGGTISVNGVPIQTMTRKELRSHYGMVLQETWLKNATVRENIAYARRSASLDQVVAAAKAAYAHGFIKRLPQGYDTVVAAGGSNLSAGQRQLLCIARIMLAEPQMLILDEATSSIDTRTEMLIQRAFDKLTQGHTSFVVAHRLSTIQSADVILVMDQGRILERGKHWELLEKGGFYAKLYESQFAREE